MALNITTRFAELTAKFLEGKWTKLDKAAFENFDLYNAFKEILFLFGRMNLIAGDGITIVYNGSGTVISTKSGGPSIGGGSAATSEDLTMIFLTMGC